MGRTRWSPQPVVAVLLVALLAACGGDVSEQPESRSKQPYAGLDERPIAGRSEQEVADLLAGRGAGYALSAELNHHPGPAHVLELAEDLELTSEQERATREIQAEMQAEARRLGEEIVALERELDEGFASGALTRQTLDELVARIAETEGRLRAAHLAAHLEMVEVLTPEQVATYDVLRGYGSGAGGHDGHTHDPASSP